VRDGAPAPARPPSPPSPRSWPRPLTPSHVVSIRPDG
jgi:hypothetical protein